MAKTLGSIIKTARNAAGMTQQALADIVGVSRAAIGQWETGSSDPSTENFLAVCKALGVEVESAIRGEYRLNKPETNSWESDGENPSASRAVQIMGRLSSYLTTDRSADTMAMMPLFVGSTLDDGPFVHMSAEPFANVQRPLALKSTADAYAVLVPDDFLSPRFEAGEYLYVSPSLTPKDGDYVVIDTGKVEHFPAVDSDGTISVRLCAMGKLVRLGLHGIEIRQHSPARSVAIRFGPGVTLHRIYPAHDLIPLVA